MASERCVRVLLSAPDYRVLDVDAQEARLVQYLSEAWWGHIPIDTIDMIRFTQRLRVYSSRVGMCAGDLMINLLREAKEVQASNLVASGQAVCPVENQQPVKDVPVEDVPAEDIPAEDVPAEDVPVDIAPPPPPVPDSPKRRPNRVK